MAASQSEKDVIFRSTLLRQPWIVQSYTEKLWQTFIDPIKGKMEPHVVPEIQGKLPFGCLDEHLILWNDKSKQYSFLNLTSMSEISLPRIPARYIRHLSVTSSLDRPECTVFSVETGEDGSSFVLFCHLNDKEWTKLPVDLGDNYLFGWSVVHQGKLYAQAKWGIVVFDVSLLIAGDVKRKIIPTPQYPVYPSGASCPRHLVKSCGHIFLVITVLAGAHGLARCMQIYRLEISSEEIWKSDEIINNEVWKRMDNIGDRAFFLEGSCGLSACAKDMEMQGNCVYFVMSSQRAIELSRFCLDDLTFTSIFLTGKTKCWSTYSWILPTKTRRKNISSISSSLASNKVTQEEEEKDNQKEVKADVYRPWCDLMTDLFQMVLQHLSLEDVGCLRTVCKGWSSIPDPFAKVRTWPWLMYRQKSDGTYRFLNPLHSTQHSLKINELSWDNNESVVTICAKDGWIGLLIDDSFILMINPFFPDIQRVVSPLLDIDFKCITFSSVPTSPDCLVFGIVSMGESVAIILWSPEADDGKWDKTEFESGCVFHPVLSNPVFFNGEFYCMGQSGLLGVFNPINKTWKILHDLEPFFWKDNYCVHGTASSYLLESQGELILVLKDNDANVDGKISVFKLDQTKMAWSKLKDIGETTIFVNPRGSFAKILPDKSYANKIFCPAFSSKNACLLYCMETKTYKTKKYGLKDLMDCKKRSTKLYWSKKRMDCKKHSTRLYSLKNPMDSVWLESNLRNS